MMQESDEKDGEGGSGLTGTPLIEGGVVNSNTHPTSIPQIPTPIKKPRGSGAIAERAKLRAKLRGEPVPTPKKVSKPKAVKKVKQVGDVPAIGVGGAFRDPGVAEQAPMPEPVIKKDEKGIVNIKFDLSVKQVEALNHPAKFLLYGGAKGGGKSWFLCVWVFVMSMRYRGNKLFFCRRRSVDFSNTTLETWKKSIPANMYRINEQKKKIFIPSSGSVIDYGGLDDPLLIQGLNSAEYAHIGIDQAEEITKDSFSMIRGTMRHRLPDGSCPPYQIRMSANPAQCWLKDDFILRPQKDMAYIPALAVDNPKLPKDYVENLSEAFKHRPHLLAAYLHGSWDDLSGNDMCIRGKWIEEAKVKRIPDGAVLKRIVINDPAISGDENVAFLMEQIGNVAYLKDELTIEHKRPLETASLLAGYRRLTRAQVVGVDCIGIGTGVVDGLVALEEPVLSINSCAKGISETKNVRYANLRAQMWWEAADKFANGRVKIPEDDYELASQLGSVKFNPSSNGKVQVESKDEIKSRLGRSPDRADAFVMGLYALDYVDRLDAQEYSEKSTDRQGHGELVGERDEEFVGTSEDYSGYNF